MASTSTAGLGPTVPKLVMLAHVPEAEAASSSRLTLAQLYQSLAESGLLFLVCGELLATYVYLRQRAASGHVQPPGEVHSAQTQARQGSQAASNHKKPRLMPLFSRKLTANLSQS